MTHSPCWTRRTDGSRTAGSASDSGERDEDYLRCDWGGREAAFAVDSSLHTDGVARTRR